MIYTLTLNPAVDLELSAGQLCMNEVNRATGSRRDCGGKGLNVSRMLAQLGVASTAMGFVGGKNGEWIAEQMQAQGVSTQFTTIAGETRTNVVLATDDHSKYIKVNDPGPVVTVQEFDALLAQIKALLSPGDWWVLAGSLPRGISSDCYARLIDTIHSAGGHTLLDASGEALRLGCTAGPTVVKPNLEEARELLDSSDLSFDQCIGQILALGPQQVVLSLGKEGVAFGDRDNEGIIPSPEIIEKNPTGAGDSLVAGLVYRLSQGDSLTDAVRFGAACGAATASLPGTQLGTAELINKLLSAHRPLG